MKRHVHALALCLACGGGAAADDESWRDEEPLMPEQAFAAEVVAVSEDAVRVRWSIAERYYMYRDKFRFSVEDGGVRISAPELPPGKTITDEFFGEVETYRGDVVVNIPYTLQGEPGSRPERFTLTALSQGCADLGLCYPPFKQTFVARLPTVAAAVAEVATAVAAPAQNPAPDPVTALSALSKSLGIGRAGDDEFLHPEQAFQVIAGNDRGNIIRLDFTVAQGYYLYRDKVKVALVEPPDNVELGRLELPAGKMKQDEYFGDVAVFYQQARASVPLLNAEGMSGPFKLKAQYQGCADAGLCYPPITKLFDLNFLPSAAAAPAFAAERAAAGGGQPDWVLAAGGERVAEQDRLAAALLNNPLWLSALLFFGLGLLLAFTPCVFPMVPILSGIIIGQGRDISTTKAFTLSLIYVLAMALTYTAVGIVAGLFGANLQAVFQDPLIIGAFVAVFVLLSLSMFGFYELQVPAAVQTRLAAVSRSQRGGTYAGVAIMGVLSAIIVGPCVTAPLLGALLVIGQTGDATLGGAALFALSLGMGAPLLLIGTSAGKLLPKAGAWMDTVKAVFGVGLLAVAIWLLERVIPGPAGLLLWAGLFIVCAVYMGAASALPPGASGWRKLWKGLGLVILVWGVLMVIGASTGARDMLNPLKRLGGGAAAAQTHLEFNRIKTVADLNRELAAAGERGQPVMLDFYADWCVYCIQMEERTFPDAGVRQALAGVHLLQADVTANDEADQALLKHFRLIAPPAILFFGADGKERKNYRVVGFQNADEFRAYVGEALRSTGRDNENHAAAL